MRKTTKPILSPKSIRESDSSILKNIHEIHETFFQKSKNDLDNSNFK